MTLILPIRQVGGMSLQTRYVPRDSRGLAIDFSPTALVDFQNAHVQRLWIVPTTDTRHDTGPGVHKHVQSADVDGWHDCQNLANGGTLDKRTSHEVTLTPPHSLDPEIRQSADIARVLRRSPMLLKDGASLRRRRRRVGEHDAVRDQPV
jgi:hypothetical protein